MVTRRKKKQQQRTQEMPVREGSIRPSFFSVALAGNVGYRIRHKIFWITMSNVCVQIERRTAQSFSMLFFLQLSRTQLIANTLYLNRDESQLFADSCAVCANHCRCRRLIHLLFTFYFSLKLQERKRFHPLRSLSFPLSIHPLWKPQSSLRENPNIVNIFVSILLILILFFSPIESAKMWMFG